MSPVDRNDLECRPPVEETCVLGMPDQPLRPGAQASSPIMKPARLGTYGPV